MQDSVENLIILPSAMTFRRNRRDSAGPVERSTSIQQAGIIIITGNDEPLINRAGHNSINGLWERDVNVVDVVVFVEDGYNRDRPTMRETVSNIAVQALSHQRHADNRNYHHTLWQQQQQQKQ